MYRTGRNFVKIAATVVVPAILHGCYATTNVGNEELNYVASEEVRARGQALYMEYCQECHGASLEGDGPGADTLDTEPANLRDKGWHFTPTAIKGVLDYPHYSREAIQDKIKYGNNTMPPLNEVLGTNEIEDLTGYITYEIRKTE